MAQSDALNPQYQPSRFKIGVNSRNRRVYTTSQTRYIFPAVRRHTIRQAGSDQHLFVKKVIPEYQQDLVIALVQG
jgi:hypothetical protein